jgi:hypothetical protein
MAGSFSERCALCDASLEVIDEGPGYVTVWCSVCATTYGMEKVAGAGGSVEYWPLFRIVLTGGSYEDADQSQSATVHKIA